MDEKRKTFHVDVTSCSGLKWSTRQRKKVSSRRRRKVTCLMLIPCCWLAAVRHQSQGLDPPLKTCDYWLRFPLWLLSCSARPLLVNTDTFRVGRRGVTAPGAPLCPLPGRGPTSYTVPLEVGNKSFLSLRCLCWISNRAWTVQEAWQPLEGLFLTDPGVSLFAIMWPLDGCLCEIFCSNCVTMWRWKIQKGVGL